MAFIKDEIYMIKKTNPRILLVFVAVIFIAFKYPLIVIPVIGVLSAILVYINVSENKKIKYIKKQNNIVAQKRQEYYDIEKSMEGNLKKYNYTKSYRELNDLFLKYAGHLSLLENENRNYWSETDYELYHHVKRMVELISKEKDYQSLFHC